MNKPDTRFTDDLSTVLGQRDQLIACSPEFHVLREGSELENAAIRELGEIVADSTAQEQTYSSST